jgi:methionine sulfoxide reductase heme-binding subunit
MNQDVRAKRPAEDENSMPRPATAVHRWTIAMHIGHDASMQRLLESWRLFRLLAFSISAVICVALPFTDFQTARGTEFIVLFTVRCALVFFLIAFIASSLAILWPNRGTRWLLSNRRYFGLAFALGMGWHLSFVAYTLLRFGNHINRMATTLDLIGLAFLLALTLTSFRAIAHRLRPASWRRLHKTGVYAIWLLATYIYLINVREDADLFHVIALGILVAAWLLRLAAWIRIQLLSRSRTRQSGRCSA